jgi:predicted metal-binding protein
MEGMRMVPENLVPVIEELIALAVQEGADKELTTYISADKIEVAGFWPRWKCTFGCPNYGNSLCCPPFIPSPDKTAELIKQYTHGVLIGFRGVTQNLLEHNRNMNKTMYTLEKAAFFKGFVKAIGFGTGTCLFCKKCIIQEDSMKGIPADVARRYCRHKNKARPSLEAAGIDVFSTVRNAGFELEVIDENNLENMKHFGLILLE